MSLRNFLTNMSVDYAPYCLVGSSRGDVHGVSPGGHCGAVLVVRRLSLAPIASLRRHRRRRRRRLGACYRHENQYSTDCRTARGGAAGVATPHGARSPPDVPAAAAAAWTVGGADRSPRPAWPRPARWVALPSIRLIPGPRRPARPGPARPGTAEPSRTCCFELPEAAVRAIRDGVRSLRNSDPSACLRSPVSALFAVMTRSL